MTPRAIRRSTMALLSTVMALLSLVVLPMIASASDPASVNTGLELEFEVGLLLVATGLFLWRRSRRLRTG
jgi:hypothetical protein